MFNFYANANSITTCSGAPELRMFELSYIEKIPHTSSHTMYCLKTNIFYDARRVAGMMDM